MQMAAGGQLAAGRPWPATAVTAACQSSTDHRAGNLALAGNFDLCVARRAQHPDVREDERRR